MNLQKTDARSSPPVRQRSRAIAVLGLVLCGLMTLLDGADGQSLSIAAPLIAAKLAMPSASVGLMFSVAAFGSGIGYLAGGVLADRRGAKEIVVLCAVTIGVFQLLTYHVESIAALIAVRFFVGLGLGGAVPGLLTLVAQIAPARLRHRFQGLLWACFPLGVLTGGIVNGWILAHVRWQDIFIVGGVAPLIIAAALWIVGPAALKRDTSDARTPLRLAAFREQGIWARALFTALIFLFANGAIDVVMNWTPSLLVQSGFAPATGAHALASSAIGALISMSITGFVVERRRIVPIILFGLAASTIAMVLLALFIHTLWAVTTLMLVLGLTLGLSGTSAVFLAAKLFPGDNQASGIGVCMAVARVGQMVFPGLIGVFLQIGVSPSGAFLLAAGLPFAGALAAWSLNLASKMSW